MKRLGILVLLFFAVIVGYGQDTIKDNLRAQQILSKRLSGTNFKSISEEQIRYLLEEDTTVRVIYNKKTASHHQPAYYINGLFVNSLSLPVINPSTIEEITVETGVFEKDNKKYSGKLHIKLKDCFVFEPITLNELKNKYLDLPALNSILIIDNRIVYDDYHEFVINERDIYKIEVQTLRNENESLNLNIVNLFTRTEKNIRESESIKIRGDELE